MKYKTLACQIEPPFGVNEDAKISLFFFIYLVHHTIDPANAFLASRFQNLDVFSAMRINQALFRVSPTTPSQSTPL